MAKDQSFKIRGRPILMAAGRLDALDAPRRQLEQQKQQAAGANAAREKARSTNKAAFRP